MGSLNGQPPVLSGAVVETELRRVLGTADEHDDVSAGRWRCLQKVQRQ